MSELLKLIREPDRLCFVIDSPQFYNMIEDVEDFLSLLDDEDVRRFARYYKIKRARYCKRHRGKEYCYEYVEVYDRQGTRYTKPRPVLRVRADSVDAERVEEVVEAVSCIDKLRGVLRELRFLLDELKEYGRRYCWGG